MMSSKLFALALLLVSPCALARVQCNAHVELRHSDQDRHTVVTEVHLDNNESLISYDGDDMCVQTTLLFEGENDATVRYDVFARNSEGEFELVFSPEVCAEYGKTAEVAVGNANSETLVLKLDATRL